MLIIFSLTLLSARNAASQNLIRGVVADSLTGNPLAGAHIIILESGEGTTSNNLGEFELATATELPFQLIIHHIGYESVAIRLSDTIPDNVSVNLTPAVYYLNEVVVSGSDFATDLMRKVIRQKKIMNTRLTAFRRGGYSRLTLERDEKIQVVSQNLYREYFDTRHGHKVIALATSESSDIYRSLGIEPFQPQPNLSDTLISIGGLEFLGLTHSSSLDVYTFSLSRQKVEDGKTVFELYVSPKTNLDATFTGKISVLDSAFVIVDAFLRPARHVEFPPPVRSWPVSYQQEFVEIAEDIWMPSATKANGRIHVDPDDAGFVPVTLSQNTNYFDYRLNATAPPFLFDSAATIIRDSVYILDNIPHLLHPQAASLTPRELDAIDELHRVELTPQLAFLDDGIEPAFALFEASRNTVDPERHHWPEIFGYEPWIRFNRVDGYFLGIGKTLRFAPGMTAEVRAAQTTGLARIRFLSRFTVRTGSRMTITGGYSRNTEAAASGSLYPTAISSLTGLTGNPDYFDYWWTKRISLEATYALPGVRFQFGGTIDNPESVEREQLHPWPASHTFRKNPPIDESTSRLLTAGIATGTSDQLITAAPANRGAISVTYSNKSMLKNNSEFLQINLRTDSYLKTFNRARPKPGALRIRTQVSYTFGSSPDFRKNILDGSIAGLSFFGSLKTLRNQPYKTDHIAALFWDHDFSRSLFRLASLNSTLPANLGVSVFGGQAFTWIKDDTSKTRDSLSHHEIGIALTGISRFNVRLDLSTRLDRPGLFLGFGIHR